MHWPVCSTQASHSFNEPEVVGFEECRVLSTVFACIIYENVNQEHAAYIQPLPVHLSIHVTTGQIALSNTPLLRQKQSSARPKPACNADNATLFLKQT